MARSVLCWIDFRVNLVPILSQREMSPLRSPCVNWRRISSPGKRFEEEEPSATNTQKGDRPWKNRACSDRGSLSNGDSPADSPLDGRSKINSFLSPSKGFGKPCLRLHKRPSVRPSLRSSVSRLLFLSYLTSKDRSLQSCVCSQCCVRGCVVLVNMVAMGDYAKKRESWNFLRPSNSEFRILFQFHKAVELVYEFRRNFCIRYDWYI